MFSCKHATDLTLRRLDAPLARHQKISLFMHWLICTPCRRFRKQIRVVHDMAAGFLMEAVPPLNEPLSEEAKERIRQKLRDESNPT